MKKVFLGGTVNNSIWRDKLIPLLKSVNIDYFDPVVENWTKECVKEENRQKEICDINLFVITPLMTGVYSIAEAVDLSNKKPEKTLFVISYEDMREDGTIIKFNKSQIKSLLNTSEMILNNGARTLHIEDNINTENLGLIIESLLRM